MHLTSLSFLLLIAAFAFLTIPCQSKTVQKLCNNGFQMDRAKGKLYCHWSYAGWVTCDLNKCFFGTQKLPVDQYVLQGCQPEDIRTKTGFPPIALHPYDLSASGGPNQHLIVERGYYSTEHQVINTKKRYVCPLYMLTGFNAKILDCTCTE
ncbi:hypothetical protein O181_007624 [Austropuccinia psidii MF-1]|uniref:Uncharacterized protein n=1 Tax=Austropuccinia psidii MF-1 TaxID=1389203 RepID=A0A9Q3BL84_9BASI|nr:hypothetical protein [Austropuccinia psidii MF-1]